MVYQIHRLFNFFIMYLFNKIMWKLINKLICNFNLSIRSLLKDGLWGCWTSSLTKAKHELYSQRCGKNVLNFLSFFSKTSMPSFGYWISPIAKKLCKKTICIWKPTWA
jgi:hypothetical protein